MKSDYTELVEDEKYLNYLESIEDKNAIESDLSVRGENIYNPGGILYITANSASGSKYYNNVPRQQSYIESRWQEDVPTFSTISVDNVSLSISTYRTDTMEMIDNNVTIIKSVEYGNLLEKIEEAEAKLTDKEKYTASTWITFESTLLSAQKIAEDASINKELVSEVYGNLKVAMDQLVLKGDATELNIEITEAEELLNNSVVGNEVGQYSQEAKNELVAAINTAKEVDEAVSKLREAVNRFKNTVVVKEEASGGITNNGSDSNESTSNNSTSTSKPNSVVNTGDSSNIFVYGILSLAVIGIVALNFKKKKEIVN